MTYLQNLETLRKIENIFITGKGMPESGNDPIFVALQKMIKQLETRVVPESAEKPGNQ